MSDELTTLFGAGRSSSLLTGQPLGRAVTKATRAEVDRVSGRAEVAHTVDTARAFLTHSAIGNVASVASTAEQCMQVAPVGGPYYEMLLHAYGVGAAQSIAGFR